VQSDQTVPFLTQQLAACISSRRRFVLLQFLR